MKNLSLEQKLKTAVQSALKSGVKSSNTLNGYTEVEYNSGHGFQIYEENEKYVPEFLTWLKTNAIYYNGSYYLSF